MSSEEGIQARARAAGERVNIALQEPCVHGLTDRHGKVTSMWDCWGCTRDVVAREFVALASDEARREREECAKLADAPGEEEAREGGRWKRELLISASESIAAAIRSRSASDPAEPEKPEPAIPDSRISNMSRLKEALAREGEIVEAQPETHRCDLEGGDGGKGDCDHFPAPEARVSPEPEKVWMPTCKHGVIHPNPCTVCETRMW